MAKFRTCPLCGAHLDHGEHCDCRENEERNEHSFVSGRNTKEDPCRAQEVRTVA